MPISTFSIWPLVADQRPGMLRRPRYPQLDEAARATLFDRLAGGIGERDEGESAGPFRFSAMRISLPRMNLCRKPGYPQATAGCEFHPGSAGFPPPLSRGGSDFRPSPSNARAQIRWAGRSIPLSRFPVRLAAAFAGFIPRGLGLRRADGLLSQGEFGTSIIPGHPPPST